MVRQHKHNETEVITIHKVIKNKIFAIIILFLTIIVFLFLVQQGYNQQVAVINKIQNNDYKVFESEFNVKFPHDTVIKAVTVVNGKDSWLKVDLIVPNAKVEEFNSSINFDYEVEKPSDGTIETIKIAKGTGDLTKFIYYKADELNTTLSLTKYKIKNNKIWEMADKVGFHPYKEMIKQ